MLEAQTHTVDDMPKPALSIEVLLATVQRALVNLRFDSSHAFPGYKKLPLCGFGQDGSKQLGGWIKKVPLIHGIFLRPRKSTIIYWPTKTFKSDIGIHVVFFWMFNVQPCGVSKIRQTILHWQLIKIWKFCWSIIASDFKFYHPNSQVSLNQITWMCHFYAHPQSIHFLYSNETTHLRGLKSIAVLLLFCGLYIYLPP